MPTTKTLIPKRPFPKFGTKEHLKLLYRAYNRAFWDMANHGVADGLLKKIHNKHWKRIMEDFDNA